jgi:hypothetical protein
MNGSLYAFMLVSSPYLSIDPSTTAIKPSAVTATQLLHEVGNCEISGTVSNGRFLCRFFLKSFVLRLSLWILDSRLAWPSERAVLRESAVDNCLFGDVCKSKSLVRSALSEIVGLPTCSFCRSDRRVSDQRRDEFSGRSGRATKRLSFWDWQTVSKTVV